MNDLTKAGSLSDEVPSYTNIIKFIFNQLYTPNTWSTLADELSAIYELLNGSGNSTSVSQRFAKRQEDEAQALPTSDSTLVISCGDSIDPGNTTIQNTWDEILFVTRNVSPLFGPLFNAQGYVSSLGLALLANTLPQHKLLCMARARSGAVLWALEQQAQQQDSGHREPGTFTFSRN